MRRVLAAAATLAAVAVAGPLCHAQTVYPIDRADILVGSRFDFKVEFPGLADPAKIRIPLQGHFANTDDWCTPQVVNDFEKAMTTGGNKPEIYRYNAAHAFANEKSPAYDAPSAKQARERTLAFLRKHVG